MKAMTLGILVLLWAVAASGDILEWEDAEGVRHYTNLKAEVPKQHQDSTQVIVDEVARRPDTSGAATDAAPAAEVPPPAAEQPRRAEVIYDPAPSQGAYVEGLIRGLEMSAGGHESGGGNVQVNGPLAVASATNPTSYANYPYPYYYPLVTTGFDRGRSRYLTLRMLLDDQFQIDREGPYFYIPRSPPPLSVNLTPILPRGLPYTVPRQARVITR